MKQSVTLALWNIHITSFQVAFAYVDFSCPRFESMSMCVCIYIYIYDTNNISHYMLLCYVLLCYVMLYHRIDIGMDVCITIIIIIIIIIINIITILCIFCFIISIIIMTTITS